MREEPSWPTLVAASAPRTAAARNAYSASSILSGTESRHRPIYHIRINKTKLSNLCYLIKSI
jgi:hypothetical protein